MGKVSLLENVLHWLDQCIREQRDWLTGVKGVSDVDKLAYYDSGYRTGFLKAYNLLKLHGHIKGGR